MADRFQAMTHISEGATKPTMDTMKQFPLADLVGPPTGDRRHDRCGDDPASMTNNIYSTNLTILITARKASKAMANLRKSCGSVARKCLPPSQMPMTIRGKAPIANRKVSA